MTYQASNQWTSHFAGGAIAYPSEYVIRIFRGNYPRLNMPKPTPGQSIVDIGCGDGRNMLFLRTLGLQVHGVEIATSLVEKLRTDLAPAGIAPKNVRLGSCAQLSYGDGVFDYALTWNSSYYMSLDGSAYRQHVAEFSRVLKPGGWIVVSVPKLSCFIFDGSDAASVPGCRIIRRDPFNIRNGETLRAFSSVDELVADYRDDFENFSIGDINDDCFGYAYHWFLMVAQKKRQ